MEKIDYEQIWRAAERDMIRRERNQRIRKGLIVPAHRSKPQMLEKDANGRWCPKLELLS